MGSYKEDLQGYLDSLVLERPSEMKKMEAYAREHSFPIVGPASGQVCYQIAKMIKAKRVFELGSGYGYSTAWFARAVQENGGGEVHHVVWDEQLSQLAQGHLHKLGYDDIVEFHVSEAVEALQQIDGPFDLIFNDIDKPAYPASLAVIAEKLRVGGVLIIDNMLWGGRVLQEGAADDGADEATQGILEATRMLMNSSQWVSSLLPIRDGLIIAHKAE